jgi:hypothetical protein
MQYDFAYAYDVFLLKYLLSFRISTLQYACKDLIHK